jgi:hypothetical protein
MGALPPGLPRCGSEEVIGLAALPAAEQAFDAFSQALPSAWFRNSGRANILDSGLRRNDGLLGDPS